MFYFSRTDDAASRQKGHESRLFSFFSKREFFAILHVGDVFGFIISIENLL